MLFGLPDALEEGKEKGGEQVQFWKLCGLNVLTFP